MHIWTDIIIRELAMLATLFALGSGPASFLGRRFDAAARVAMAPVLGLCVGTCVFTTLIWFTAARDTYWLLPVLAVISVAIAASRTVAAISTSSGETRKRSRAMLLVRRLGLRDALALVVVCVVVTAPLSYTLHERHSVGPTGFEVWDAVGYTAEIDGMTQQSIRVAARQDYATAKSFIDAYWEFYAAGNQNLDAAPLSANLNELIGLHSTDTQSLFFIVFLLAGALGAFASVRYAAPKPSWAAPFAGVLFAGPFFMQLIADGSQAAICGLSLILPLFAVGADALRGHGRPFASLVLLALLASGLIALYPLFVPGVAISAVVVLLAVAIVAARRGDLSRRTLVGGAGAIVVVLAMTIVLNLVSFLRDAGYWHDVFNGAHIGSGLPQYELPISVLPGWLLQTREFYSLTNLAHAPFHEVLTGVVLPAILVVAILAGLWYRRRNLILVPLIIACAVLAEYTSVNRHCSYCVDRNSLPIAPLAIGLLALGLAALATAPRRWLRWTAVVVAILAILGVAARTRQERMRFANGSYFLEAGNRALLSHVPPHAGVVDLEGYGEDPGKATGELPFVYFMTSERDYGDVSVPTEYTDYASLAYLGESNPKNPQFTPSYRYVLTRFAGMQTGRRVLARTGSLALEERAGSLDATVVSGVAVPSARLNAQGLAWVEGPLHMIVVGGGPSPAWISLRFRAIVPVTVPPQSGVQSRSEKDGELSVCVPATGKAPLRKATLTLSFPLAPGVIPPEPFALQEPPQGVQLIAMRAVAASRPTEAGQPRRRPRSRSSGRASACATR